MTLADPTLSPSPLQFTFQLFTANVGLLSFLGYTAYVHKDARVWNRNYVAAAVAGTLGLFAVEG